MHAICDARDFARTVGSIFQKQHAISVSTSTSKKKHSLQMASWSMFSGFPSNMHSSLIWLPQFLLAIMIDQHLQHHGSECDLRHMHHYPPLQAMQLLFMRMSPYYHLSHNKRRRRGTCHMQVGDYAGYAAHPKQDIASSATGWAIQPSSIGVQRSKTGLRIYICTYTK